MRLDHVSKANFEASRAGFGSRIPAQFVSGRYEHPQVSGGDLEEATPDPIPNSEVKLLGADGTAREAVWESRTLPGFFPQESSLRAGSFAFLSTRARDTRTYLGRAERGRLGYAARTCIRDGSSPPGALL